MDAIEIRAATPHDADAVECYHDRCFTSTYSSQLLAGKFEAPDREGTKRQLRAWFQPESEFETRVAVVDGRGAHSRWIRPRIRLGQAEAADDLALGHLR